MRTLRRTRLYHWLPMPDAPKVAAEEAAVLARGAVDSLPQGALATKLQSARAESRPLRVKLGIDPTAPDIHLGHAVVLGKLREFQDAGHRVVLIVGDYTARVGDPSGRSSLRPMLSEAEIEANAATFQEQALKILDPDPDRLEVRRNSEWLDMGLTDLLGLVRTTTVAQLLERDDFAKRMTANEPISMLELLYPLLQGYDSVAVEADLELGGTDQKFNLLLGREIQRAYQRPEQAVMTMPILAGTDGRQKMSKSLGNQIGVTDAPEEMYGKTMSIPDEAMAEYYGLLLHETPLIGTPPRTSPQPPPDSPSDPGHDPSDPSNPTHDPSDPSNPAHDRLQPRDAKRALARGIVAWLYSEQDAQQAEQEFDRVHLEHAEPEKMSDARACVREGGTVHMPEAIAEAFGISRSEARRLIDQGGVTLGGSVLAKGEHDVPAARADGEVLKVGKRRFRRLRAG
jgi:tyrosyl-tRNA synthetase